MMETYVVCNSEGVAPYYESFLNELYKTYSPNDPLIDQLVESELQNIEDDLLRSLYWGPKQLVKTWPCYFVNGFNFHTEDHSVGKSTMNCEVCVKSSSYRDTENDYYGMLEEIIELDYPLNDDLHVVLFKCRWVDPTREMKVHPHYHLVDVNFKWVYQKDEPFILAQQAVQVYYTEYRSMKRDKIDWMTVCKTKVRRVESHYTSVAYQIDEEVPVPEVNTNNQTYDLHDPDGLKLIADLTSAMQHGVRTSRLDEDDEDEDDEIASTTMKQMRRVKNKTKI
ncbi:UNVERIFIED_CONTAM: hypothetical protein Sangu_2858100 [Sesamum angustifolium]|uniref:DUF4216 domain-containing protein n=1 Tax=Sesamum angustifolium TaxID=2727405 RepID=A0AAW2IPB4_9LAMI